MPNFALNNAKSGAPLHDLDLAFALALDLRGPVKPRWPNAGFAQRVTRQDAGLAATRPGMDDRGGPLSKACGEGMPSLSEAPRGWGKKRLATLRFSKWHGVRPEP